MNNPNTKMKKSGVEWIGDIPEGWGVVKMKYLAQICNGADFKEHTVEEGGFPVYGSGGIFSRSSKYLYNETSVLLGRKGSVDKPKIVFEPFWCSDTTYFTKIYKKVKPIFFYFLVQQIKFDQYIYGSTIPSMTKSVYDDMVFPLPPLKEQEQIIFYLNEKTSHIDKLLDISKRKIGLLKEQRASIINQVVTKGLNPNAKMKNSGVEWIGDIPEGWGVNKMKYGVKLITEKALTNLNDVKISPENVEPMTGNCFNYYSTYLGEGIKFRKGDVLLNKLRIYLKKIVLVSMDGYSMGEMLVLRCNEKFFNEYFYYQIFHQGLIDLLNSQSNGVKLPRVSSDIILNTLVAFPPLEEQEKIVAHLDEKTSIIDKSISIEERRIGLLKEYRQSIISQVVTGKIKVIADE